MMGQILSIFAQPGSVLFSLLLLSLPLSWWGPTQRWGIRLGVVVLVIVLGLGAVPLRDTLLRPLEDSNPVASLPERVDGIMVLGGAEEPGIYAARGWPELNGNADRLIAFVALARRYPEARLVFSGGSAVPHAAGTATEADVAAGVFDMLGLDPARVMYERTSRNTAENAANSQAIIKPQAGESWILVTSARHMPRAMASFAAVGWPMQPYPVDFQTGGEEGFSYSPLNKLSSLNFLAKEWLGMIGYRILGYTAEILPWRRASDAKP